MLYAYPYVLEPQPEGGFSVSFPDVPEAHTQGETLEEAHTMAEDALVAALSFYVDASQPLPRPSPTKGRPVALVPILVAAKLALHDSMVSNKITNVELGRILGIDEKATRRFRDLLHNSHIRHIEAALKAIGYRLALVSTKKGERQE